LTRKYDLRRETAPLKIKYFAYGSNMFTARLRFRVLTCEFVSIARLPEHQLRFHKKSKDGSSKCDAFYTGVGSDAVWGVVFNIHVSEKSRLDKAEGLGGGYNAHSVSVMSSLGKCLEATTYLADATAIVKDRPPYTWYKEFVERGAAEHYLPADYVVAAIRAVKSVPDPNPQRERAKLCN
jgi:AIG2-like family